MLALDFMRGVTLALAFFVEFEILLVLFRALRAGRQSTGRWKLMLPSRVTVTGFGAFLVVLGYSAVIASRLGQPFDWYVTPLALPGLAVLAYGVRGHIIAWRPRGTPSEPTILGRTVDPVFVMSLFTTLLVASVVGFISVDRVQHNLDDESKDRQADQTREAKQRQAAQAREARERRDETCTTFENDEAAALKQVEDTEKFLRAPPDPLKALVPFAASQLPQLRKNAKARKAPDYCNDPHVGLAEPKPKGR